MSKLRLLFIKEAQAAYISHLDLMRTFQRCFDMYDKVRPWGTVKICWKSNRAAPKGAAPDMCSGITQR